MNILTNPLYRPLLEILRAARNGIVYGGKLRFSHALVISLLYRSGPLAPRLKQVLEATKNHAEVLASFAIIYKACCKIFAHEALLGPKNLPLIKFVAGSIGSWIVYSQHFDLFHSGITHQITLYCFSRVMIACGKMLLDQYLSCAQPKFRNYAGDAILYKDLTANQQKKLKSSVYNKSWKYFAILTWGLVMLIYDIQPQYLQSSLRHSMAYIYDVEMETWSNWREFLGF
ncbi:peroxisomal membrane protein 4 [Suhomyces tanzawaensis NRRL Y-17324]|uniref:Peroxisomal membrane protein 4 n=1 Tax=Suhomyces tanzawaensis NRRL Y-17324 TaxID=984487 RepID=A0A1E4SM30_9ASCO|nr:peroxisomal membrane protein 4 [Suhomyces tanzawaensis NRRL Y-17324]ODV80584.1 peroxisomal membrane protein 4 [Suhomyces tanzawaensis NRRL Y-17324]